MANQFFIIFALTILLVRIIVYLKPIPAPTIKGFRTHHWMFGLVLAFIGFFSKNIPIFAVGIGLFVDELTYILIRGKTHEDNYSKISLFGTLIFIILVYFFRAQLVALI